MHVCVHMHIYIHTYVCICNNNKEKVAINFRMWGYGRSLREGSSEELEGGKTGEKEMHSISIKNIYKRNSMIYKVYRKQLSL